MDQLLAKSLIFPIATSLILGSGCDQFWLNLNLTDLHAKYHIDICK